MLLHYAYYRTSCTVSWFCLFSAPSYGPDYSDMYKLLQKKEQEVIKMMVAIFIGFCLTYLPSFLTTMVKITHKSLALLLLKIEIKTRWFLSEITNIFKFFRLTLTRIFRIFIFFLISFFGRHQSSILLSTLLPKNVIERRSLHYWQKWAFWKKICMNERKLYVFIMYDEIN